MTNPHTRVVVVGIECLNNLLITIIIMQLHPAVVHISLDALNVITSIHLSQFDAA